MFFFFSSRRRHTRCALVTGVQTCALPILSRNTLWVGAVDADADHRKSSDEEGWLHPLSLGFAGLLRGPAADSDASSEGRTRHGSNPFSTYSGRSEEHTSELQSLMRSSYAVFCLTKKKHI